MHTDHVAGDSSEPMTQAHTYPSYERLVIPPGDALDEIILYLDDIAPKQGYATIVCYGCAWNAYWGSMWDGRNVMEFMNECDTDYVGMKFKPTHNQTRATEKYMYRIVGRVKNHIEKLIANRSNERAGGELPSACIG